MREKKAFYINRYTKTFSSEDAFPKVSLPAEKPKLFINVSDSKENENNVDVTGWMLTS